MRRRASWPCVQKSNPAIEREPEVGNRRPHIILIVVVCDRPHWGQGRRKVRRVDRQRQVADRVLGGVGFRDMTEIDHGDY